MRLFVALDISEDVRRRAETIVERLERLLVARGRRDRPRASPVRWVSAPNLHLTLQFIGEVGDELVEAIETRLAPPFGIEPFEISLAGIGAFPPAGGPRVVWLGVADGAARVREVQREVVRRLEGLSLRTDDRPFSAHVTLGRFRETAVGYRRRLEEVRDLDAGRCTIEHVTLYQSRLSPRGATYVPRRRVPLSA